MTPQTHISPRLVSLAAAAAAVLLAAGACSSEGANYDRAAPVDDASTGGGGGGGGGGENPPEREEEFEFSAPAVVGETMYVANATLNAVAAIDTETLSIETVPAGFQPTQVVGPAPEHADSDAARVMALNTGDDSVTIIDPSSNDTTRRSVMRGANALDMDPTGQYAVAWYDDSTSGDEGGDLSSVTVVTPESTHEVAVGFHVREVFFSDDGSRALIWSDDGVSPIDLDELDGDTVAAPIPLLPSEVGGIDPGNLEIVVSDDAEHVVTRSGRLRGVVALEVGGETHHVVPTFEVPTDVDVIRGEQTRDVLIVLRESGRALRAALPEGLVNAADALSDEAGDISTAPDESMAGSTDAGTLDAGTTDTGTSGADTTTSDASGADGSAGDADGSAGDADASGAEDAAAVDTGTADSGTSDAGDATGPDAGDADAGTTPSDFAGIEDLEVIDIQVDGLGAASVGARAEHALLFTTVGDDTRVVLLNLESLDQRTVALQKKVRGARSDARGDSFIVYNQKQPGEIPDNATPNDPEYIARSWGLTLIDVETATTRVLLSRHEPGPTALWSPVSGDAKTYTIFKAPPRDTERVEPSRRDVIEANLSTFRTRTHRVPSIPDAVGPIQPAGKVFVSQRHPQGRMTFIDAETEDRQTITGYQLNSEID